ncbi:MAG: hypothetical protein JXX29_13895 [Deltaproteobacteria bacterium]|nr:hypothetical protein [Deltaproteobacteria bacterium]MBN2672769.1 hypothetical protein [Deltaproteobacteria bacterium]
MIQDNKDIYERYVRYFEEKFGAVELGEPVRNDEFIVKKLSFDDFVVAWSEYKRTEEFLRETMSLGNTLSDAVEYQYRELCAQVLEKPKDFKLL